MVCVFVCVCRGSEYVYIFERENKLWLKLIFLSHRTCALKRIDFHPRSSAMWFRVHYTMLYYICVCVCASVRVDLPLNFNIKYGINSSLVTNKKKRILHSNRKTTAISGAPAPVVVVDTRSQVIEVISIQIYFTVCLKTFSALLHKFTLAHQHARAHQLTHSDVCQR